MIRSKIPNILKKLNYAPKPISASTQYATYSRPEDDEKWNRLYLFQDMNYLAIVTRLKIYPALFTAIGTPFGIAAQIAELHPGISVIPGIVTGEKDFSILSMDIQMHSSITGIVSTSILAAYSALLNKTIGIVEICRESKKVKLYYIDFVGKQNTKVVTMNELRNCEKSKVKFNLYRTIKLTDDKGEPMLMKIPSNRGDIYDTMLFKKLFGK